MNEFGPWASRREPTVYPKLPPPNVLLGFPDVSQPRLFDPGEIPWYVPALDDDGNQIHELGEPQYRLNPQVERAWNERWRGRKVRVSSAQSGLTEGYCAGVGPGYLGPSIRINTSPGSSQHIAPQNIIRMTEIEHFPGDDAWAEVSESEEDGYSVVSEG